MNDITINITSEISVYKKIERFTISLDEEKNYNVYGYIVTEYEQNSNDAPTCYIEPDYDSFGWYQEYDKIFGTYKGYKECKELHDIIEKLFGKMNSFENYQDSITIHTGF